MKLNTDNLSLSLCPKVTIITVVYNRVAEIEDTILSVLNQTYADLEYIVIDGGSTDGSLDIIRKYDSQLAYWISEPDKGIYDAMNKGIRQASGEWVNFMNAGDAFWSPEIVSKSMAYVQAYPSAGVLYGDTVHKNPFGKVRINARPLEGLMREVVFCHQSCFVRTDLLKQMPFDLTYRYVADYDLLSKLYRAGISFVYYPEVISLFAVGAGASFAHAYTSIREHYSLPRLEVKGSRRMAYLKKIVKWTVSLYFIKLCPLFLRKKIFQKRYKNRIVGVR